MPPPSLQTSSFAPARIRSYLFRLPLFTRIVLFAIVLLWILELQTAWNVLAWAALVPAEVGLSSMHRLNTYPFIHINFLHMFFNTLALMPLMERFEAEHGTLLSTAFFIGPLSTFPAGLYVLLEKFILRSNTSVQGASVWVFVLLGHEAIKTWKQNPWFSLSTYRIPTWTTPLFFLVAVTALIPNTSFLGHTCALAVGYAFGLGYLRFLAPPERILRWVEGKLNLLGRLPHYVSVDQKTYGRYGVLPTPNSAPPVDEEGTRMSFLGAGQRLGP